jgi:hypothetical protein
MRHFSPLFVIGLVLKLFLSAAKPHPIPPQKITIMKKLMDF